MCSRDLERVPVGVAGAQSVAHHSKGWLRG